MNNIYLHLMTVYRIDNVTVDNETSTQWVAKHSNVKCHLSVKSISKSPNTFDNVGTNQEFKLFYDVGTSIVAGDKIVVTVEDKTYSFKAQKPFKYLILKKYEVVVESWQE